MIECPNPDCDGNFDASWVCYTIRMQGKIPTARCGKCGVYVPLKIEVYPKIDEVYRDVAARGRRLPGEKHGTRAREQKIKETKGAGKKSKGGKRGDWKSGTTG